MAVFQPGSCFHIITVFLKNTHVERVVISTSFQAPCEMRYSHLHSSPTSPKDCSGNSQLSITAHSTVERLAFSLQEKFPF